jgi:deoxyribonuclease V
LSKDPSNSSPIHRWDLNPKQAVQIQNELRSKVVIEPYSVHQLNLIAGVDVGLPRGGKIARAGVAVLEFPSMKLVDQAWAEIPVTFPYVPGLLSFREIPVIIAAMDRLNTNPDLYLVDGHGLAHPRRFGLACHLGLWLDRVAVGCGKSILVGDHEPLESERGSVAPLMDAGETIGAAVRTRNKVKPVYISIGHRIDLPSAIKITLDCGCGLRLPEPVRWAHKLAST